MRFKLVENIYSGETNNKKNKRKKHSLSPFISLDAGNVEYNVSMFNKAMGNETSAETGAVSEALNEDTVNSLIKEYMDVLTLLDDKYEESYKPTYTFSYKGPVYRFEKLYDILKEPVYTMAQNKKHAATMLKGKLKKKYGFANNAKLDIDEDKIELEDPQDDKYNLDKLKSKPNYARFVTNLVDREIYTVDGIYKVEGLNMEFPSLSELYDYLEGEENYD